MSYRNYKDVYMDDEYTYYKYDSHKDNNSWLFIICILLYCFFYIAVLYYFYIK